MKLLTVGQKVLEHLVKTILTLRGTFFYGVLFFIILQAKAAYAIPSPELIIGSVSSLSQVVAAGVAMVAALGATVAAKLGLNKRGPRLGKFPTKLVTVLVCGLIALVGANYWQYTSSKNKELARLQATLLRPAQFDGSTIKDADLKETSFSAQSGHPQGISTADAFVKLEAGETQFFDIRETGEHEMGTLPGATHIRFPDFLETIPVQPGGEVVLFCHNGNRSSETCAELAKLGIDCRFIVGGIEKWITEGYNFSDEEVETIADLRAIPEYPNSATLLSTETFSDMLATTDLQIVDTRYPGDFASGHLPGAINIPIRAMTTNDLQARIRELENKPTIAACYDRRSCFMSQVLGLELSRAGIDFKGRYTLPWEYFVPPAPKPHVQEWLTAQNSGLWDKAIAAVAVALKWSHQQTHLFLGLLALSVLTRLLVLPIALKSERDQLRTQALQPEIKALKERLAEDPVRKARALQSLYKKQGMTPMRNLLALLFLPVMMLGVSAAGLASKDLNTSFLWSADIGAADPYFVVPVVFTALAMVYLLWAVAKTPRQKVLWSILGAPALFAMVATLSFAANVYLCFSLSLLLVQRAYVVGAFSNGVKRLRMHLGRLFIASAPKGVVVLGETERLLTAGNKAMRLSVLQNAGLPVPGGVVLTSDALERFGRMNEVEQQEMADKVWMLAGEKLFAVRSSASNEDGAGQSFAGVFDSVLNVTEQTMLTALRDVLDSFQSARSDSYDTTAEGAGQANILVQEMVDAEMAGVLFTQDPMAPGMVLLEWVKGTGDDLVSGRVTPQIERFGRYTGAAVGDTAPGGPDFTELLMLAREIEAVFDTPQDVEWAYAKGQFRILQTRDITTLDLGTAEQKVRSSEWSKLLERFAQAAPDEVILEQDEMSEVLPRPTPLSFSMINRLWAPGGSLDLASRALALPYRLDEEPGSHLVNLFGKTYVDRALKEEMALRLSGSKSKQLRKQARDIQASFPNQVLPEFHAKLAYWRALDYVALPQAALLETLDTLVDEFVGGIYVEAEKINILAGFTMGEALARAAGDLALKTKLMQGELPHAPSTLIAECKGNLDEALAHMGHRAMFDYELSSPRYHEAPSLLKSLMEPTVEILKPLETGGVPLPEELKECIDLAVSYQDLKERAKHEALRLYAEIRRALLALGAQTGLDTAIFYLTIEDVLRGDWAQTDALLQRAKENEDLEALRKPLAPSQVSLTLHDIELLSLGEQITAEGETLAGTCVAGQGPVSGRVFWVDPILAEENGPIEVLFDGFEPGDILVCQMLHPAWLPQMLQAGAVLSEIGGWLSHMSIVAREKNKLMLVSCSGLQGLTSGQQVTINDDGSIDVAEIDTGFLAVGE